MALAVITLKIMPENAEINLDELKEKSFSAISEFVKEEEPETKTEIEPIAFGLSALKIIFVMDESIGSPDPVAEIISKFEEVASAEIVDARRAIG